MKIELSEGDIELLTSFLESVSKREILFDDSAKEQIKSKAKIALAELKRTSNNSLMRPSYLNEICNCFKGQAGPMDYSDMCGFKKAERVLDKLVKEE